MKIEANWPFVIGVLVFIVGISIVVSKCSAPCPPCPQCVIAPAPPELTEDEKKMKDWAKKHRKEMREG